MAFSFIRSFGVLATAFLLLLSPAFGGDMKTDQALDYLNARLAHSAFMRIDANGLVQVKAPDRILKFNLKEVAFSYNGLNDDDRLRVVGDACIESYDGDRLDEVRNRESFLCRSHNAAREAIETLRQLKRR